MSELMTQAEFARHRDVSKKTVTVWKRDGRLVWRDGKIDAEASDTVLDGHSSPGNPSGNAGGNSGNGDPGNADPPDEEVADPASGVSVGPGIQRLLDKLDLMTTAQAEQVKQNYLALKHKIDHDREAERVVEVERVAQEVANEYAKVRAKLLELPTELAPKIAHLTDANEIRDQLAAGITKALEELTHDDRGDAG